MEAVALAALIGYGLLGTQWRPAWPLPGPETIRTAVALTLLPAAVLSAISAVMILVQRRGGWLLAMMAQGMLLSVCLALHAMRDGAIADLSQATGTGFVLPLMAYGVLTVLHLNTRHVRAAVYDRTAHEGEDGDDGNGAAVRVAERGGEPDPESAPRPSSTELLSAEPPSAGPSPSSSPPAR